MTWKEFQRKCPYREWESFGHYKCQKTEKGCPLLRSDKCPEFIETKTSSKMDKSATFSDCRKYRYTLTRYWGGMFSSGNIVFIGLNPSTADETTDDPTIRRCIGYAKAWGYSGLIITNLFAYRATDPKEMMATQDPVGPGNNNALVGVTWNKKIIIAIWGNNGKYLDRDEEVRKMIPNLHYLKLTKNGFPAHPLYLPKGLKPILWN